MVRRLGVLLAAALLTAAMLPASVAAVGQGSILHGGKPAAPVTVQCAIYYDGYDYWYDVFATIDPELVTEAVTNGEAVALAYQKTSAKASALAFFLDELYTGALPYINFVYAEDILGEGWPFVYVQVVFGYVEYFDGENFVVLASGTAKCQKGSLDLGPS
jgi:hypothetical protein